MTDSPEITLPEMCSTHFKLLMQQAGYKKTDSWRALYAAVQIVLFQATSVHPQTKEKLGDDITKLPELGCLACFRPDSFGEIVQTTIDHPFNIGKIKGLGDDWVYEGSSPGTVMIMNLRHRTPNRPEDFKVDRSSPLGNPFNMKSKRDEERDKVCDDYEAWFHKNLDEFFPNGSFIRYLERIRKAYETHKKVRLFCWCHPKRCHAETIKAWLKETVKFEEGN